MRKRTVGLVLAGTLATGAVGAVALTPAVAASADGSVGSRLDAIKNALASLVTDGTITQAQADKVATTLDSRLPARGGDGHGGRGGGLGMKSSEDAAAKALGMTAADLHTAMESGKSLADVAKEKNVSVDSVVSAMVAAAEADLATAVKDGKLTQAQADTIKGTLTQRVTDRVNAVRPQHGDGQGAKGTPPTGAPSAPSGAATSS